LIACCDAVPNTFLRGYCFDLAKQLGIWLELTTNRPRLYLSDSEPCEVNYADEGTGGTGWFSEDGMIASA